MGVSTRQKKKDFLEALEKTRGIVSAVCEMSGIARSTYYHWMKKDKKFAEKVELINRSKLDVIEDRIFAKAMSGEMKALLFMHTHLNHKYNEKKETVKESKVHIYHHVDKRPDAKKEKTLTESIWEEGRRRYYIAHPELMPPVEVVEEES